MAFVTVYHVARFQLIYDNYGETAMNVIHIEKSAGATWYQADLVSKATILKDWWNGYMAPLCNSDVALLEIKAVDLTSEFAEHYEYVAPSPFYGSFDGTPLPQNCTAVVSSHTGGRGRSYNGRTYVVGLSAQQVTNGKIHSSVAASLVAAFTQLKSLLYATSYYPVIVSYQHNGVKLNPASYYRVSAYSCNLDMDSQRRRLPGR